jgi:hypothetical protein
VGARLAREKLDALRLALRVARFSGKPCSNEYYHPPFEFF